MGKPKETGCDLSRTLIYQPVARFHRTNLALRTKNPGWFAEKREWRPKDNWQLQPVIPNSPESGYRKLLCDV